MPSSSLIPAGDPTLLLTNAGMVQFKPYFTGEMTPPSKRMTSVQKCFRTTDIDAVGDSTHLTFFEMLGNFSVGDYFKSQAIQYAWEFLTNRLGLSENRLWITIYIDDDEAHSYWKGIGVPDDHIKRFNESDNFWGPAGNEGPCGPCSEIHYDFGAGVGCKKSSCGPNCENYIQDTTTKCTRFVELWNLVFMEYYQDSQGNRKPLPSPNIDTGMGLERCAVILQGKNNIYETELLQNIVLEVANLAGKQYGSDVDSDYSIRVVAEHARSATFLISDGVVPGNEGRDYVLRRLIRRSVRYGIQLGLTGPFLSNIVSVVIEEMAIPYPDLLDRKEFILRVIGLEEERFIQVFEQGHEILSSIINYRSKVGVSLRDGQIEIEPTDYSMLGDGAQIAHQSILNEIFKHKDIDSFMHSWGKTISGYESFIMYDTYGFPPELTEEIAREKGVFGIDWSSFEQNMEAQRERGRAASSKFGGDLDVLRTYQELGLGSTSFLGYETLTTKSVIESMLSNGNVIDHATKGDNVAVVLKETPFYSEMGGQVGDSGNIVSSKGVLSVTDTQAPMSGITVHICEVIKGSFSIGDAVEAHVDVKRREDTARNHTATHLLHASLREILGSHVRQNGSLVSPDRLRFDFTHVGPLSEQEIIDVQKLTNEKIRENMGVSSKETTYRQALSAGALAFFGDRYGDQVRMVEVGNGSSFSLEICGGTHVHRTGDIGYCLITMETGIGAGLRRLEALTGRAAETTIESRSSVLSGLSQHLQVPYDQISTRVQNLLEELDQSKRNEQNLERELINNQMPALKREEIAGVAVISGKLKVSTTDLLREAGDALRNQINSGIVSIGAVVQDKPIIILMATKDLVNIGFHCGNFVRNAAQIMGGGGGGRPETGQAGGRDPDQLDKALAEIKQEIAKWQKKT